MIKKRYLFLTALLTLTSLAAGEDEEILKDLEFFKSFELVRNLEAIKKVDPKIDPKKNEVTHEAP